MKTYGWLKWFVLLVFAVPVPVCSAAVVPITGVTCDHPNGTAPYNLLSITVGDYTVLAERLGVGTSSIVPDGTLLSRLDNLDLSDGYSTSAGTTYKTVGFGGTPTWKDSNGDNPDFFIFESGGEDSPAIAAILPGGVLGQAVTVSGKWGQTNYNRPAVSVDGEAMQNQPIVGFALAITDLLDASGKPLTNSSVIEGIQTIRNGTDPMTYCAVMPPATQAKNPNPADQATDVLRGTVVSWEPAESAQTHDIYFGTMFDTVNNASRTAPMGVLVSPGQDANSYDPVGPLVLGQTYYWRIDEVSGPPDSTISKGHVWSFTVEPYAYPIRPAGATASSAQPGMGPEKTIDGSGLTGDLHGTEPTTMWLSTGVSPTWIQYEFDRVYKLYDLQVWNSNQLIEAFLGLGARSVAIETSIDGATWAALDNVPEFARASGAAGYAANTTVSFGGISAKYVRLTIEAPWGGAGVTGLSEVRFSYVPVQAFEPEPADGATGVSVETDLSWRAGREAASHQVYVSADRQAVVDGTAAAVETPGPRYEASLDLGQSYYWKVVEVNDAQTPTSWEGEVWSFATANFVTVEDFENYADDEGNRIYETWIDGYGTTTNGSQVGYIQAPFAETTIIHGGKQSMPLSYNNTGGMTTSEATRTFASPQDWTKHGITTLVLHFYGDPANPAGQIYVKLNGTKVVYSGVANALKTPYWTQWNLDLASAGANVKAITKLAIGVEGSGQGIVYVDDIMLYGTAPKPPEDVLWIEAESGTITNPMGAHDDPTASGGKYISTENLGITGTHVDGIATYPITVKGGTYKIYGRVVDMPTGRNSFWVRIQGAALDTVPDADGWINWNFPNGATWHWDDVSNGTNSLTDPPVHFTLTAGNYTLEIAYREDGARLDAIVITDAAD